LHKKIVITLPAASTIPSGGWYAIRNTNTGAVTIPAWIDGVGNNPYLLKGDMIIVLTNTYSWHGVLHKSGSNASGAYYSLNVNPTSNGKEWMPSLQSLMTAPGDITYASAAHAPERIPIGPAGYTLRCNAAGNAPEWGYWLKETVSGDDLTASSDAEATAGASSYTKVKEIKIPRSGTLKVSFQLKKTAGSIGYAYGKVYRNGSAVGPEHGTNSSEYVLYTDVISGWSVGDLCQLYTHYTNASYETYANNFRLYTNNDMGYTVNL
jgi:hypothetical protein